MPQACTFMFGCCGSVNHLDGNIGVVKTTDFYLTTVAQTLISEIKTTQTVSALLNKLFVFLSHSYYYYYNHPDMMNMYYVEALRILAFTL